jgi:phosphotriesterase-related protein
VRPRGYENRPRRAAFGDGNDNPHIAHIQRLLDAGPSGRILLSHDRGWYDPAKRGGGTPKPSTYLTETFLPKLRAAGVDAQSISKLTGENLFRAFARSAV